MPIYAQSSTLRNLLIPLVAIDQTTLEQDQILQYNATTGKFENQQLSLTNSDFLVGADSVGTGAEVYKEEIGNRLKFKTLTAGNGVTITPGTNEITIASDAATTSAANIGTGTGIFTTKSGQNIQLRSLKLGTGNINLSLAASGTGNEIEFVNTAEINTATELANTMRGTLPALRKPSSSKRVLSRFERMPKSKSCSHSPETAEAK